MSEKDKPVEEAVLRQKAKDIFNEARDNRKILELILSDLINMSSEVQDDIKRVYRVPLLHNGIALEEIAVNEVGDVLFLFGDEQATARCQNVDDETIPIYANCFVVEIGTYEDIPRVMLGSTLQMSITSQTSITQNIDTINTLTTLNEVTTLSEIANLQVLKGTLQPPTTGFNTYAAAGNATLITIPLQAAGVIIHVSDIAISGDVAGYGWLEYAGNIVWGRLNFPANSGWAQQIMGDFQITSDGTNSLLVRAYLGAAGRADASILYSLE